MYADTDTYPYAEPGGPGPKSLEQKWGETYQSLHACLNRSAVFELWQCTIDSSNHSYAEDFMM